MPFYEENPFHNIPFKTKKPLLFPEFGVSICIQATDFRRKDEDAVSGLIPDHLWDTSSCHNCRSKEKSGINSGGKVCRFVVK